ncbi:polymeric immunoglobulin receptor-like [Sardina pilchardus]|uniref:polymeric immunoglobulin receptor-like n=1 Tax=Sardina pilchardus TaxID=27697 RepID=UPI002E12E518
MALFVTIIFLLIPVGWCEVAVRTGYIGESTNIYCTPPPQLSTVLFRLCKRTDGNKCNVIISTKAQGNPHGTRYTMADQGHIVINPISDSDTGEYWCIWESNGKLTTTEKIKFWAIPITGYIGGKVEMKLLYGSGYENKGKYLQREGCLTSLIYIQNGQTRTNKEKYSLYDYARTKELTLTIRGLEAEDSGKYMFGILDVGVFPEWPLIVKALINVSNFEGHNTKIPCKYQTARSSGYLPHFCRGRDPGECLEQGALENRLSYEDSAAEKVLIVSIYNLRAEDSGIYWCVDFPDRGPEFTAAIQLTVKKYSSATVSESDTISVTWVLVPVVMLLLLATGLLVVKYKKTSERAPDLPGSAMFTNTARTIKETVDYEYDDVSASQTRTANLPQRDFVRHTPHFSRELYQDLNPNTNQGNSIYMSL